MKRVTIAYAAARPQIVDGDLLLFRRRGLVSIAGRGEHAHAGKAVWARGILFCVEIREWCGGRAVTLSSQVAKYPGRIDVFEANPEDHVWQYDRVAASLAMLRLAGTAYGWRPLLLAALLHLPLLRLFVHPDTDDQATDRRPPFCSMAVAWAERTAGGFDPVPHLADRLTEPADLARSPFYRYRFTLVP